MQIQAVSGYFDINDEYLKVDINKMKLCYKYLLTDS